MSLTLFFVVCSEMWVLFFRDGVVCVFGVLCLHHLQLLRNYCYYC